MYTIYTYIYGGDLFLQRSFARSLEKRLSDVELASPVEVDPEASYGEVRRVFRETRARVAAVVGRRRELLGLIYRSNVLRVTGRKTMARAKDLMVDPLVTVGTDTTLLDAVNLMLKLDEWYLPVVEGKEIVGMVGLENAIEELLASGAYQGVRASDAMTRNPISVKTDDPLTKVWEIMVERKYAGLPVVHRDGRLAGIVTQYDLIRRGFTRIELEAGGPGRGIRVREAMNPSVEYLFPWTGLERAAEMVIIRGYGRIPVVDSSSNRILVGILDREDLVRVALRRV